MNSAYNDMNLGKGILTLISVIRSLFETHFIRHNDCRRLLALVVVAVLPCVQTPLAQAEQPAVLGGYVWLDVNGQPLPFQDDETIREVMRSARVISREIVGRGVAGVEKFVLEHEGIRFHAAYRSVDVTVREPPSGGAKRSTMKYRDAAIFERAAYEISVLLGIGRVPPVVVRRVDKQIGTVQIWVEETRPEVELLERNELQPPDVSRWLQQKKLMYVFDSLIANSDRNQGNLLIDRSWNIWFIDHTRAFKRSSKLLYQDKLTACERQLWESLREIDEETIRQRLEPYLESQEITRLLSRRRKLIGHIQSLIDKHGEDAVLFDLRPPGIERASWDD